MQELSKSHAGMPRIEELTLTLRELAARIAPHGTFNFLLSNGQALWAHASTSLYYIERRHPFSQAQLCDEDMQVDFLLSHAQDKVAVVVTAPLTTNEEWTAFQSGEMRVFVDGECLAE
jgi:glutamine amidotransferase